MAAPRSFAVIGAGVAGLQAAAQLKEAGYSVAIFEKTEDVGGVWQQNYAGYRLQVRKWHYEIPGYAWPDHTVSDAKYPTGQEVEDYLRAYARDAGLLPLIRFGVDVKAVRPQPLPAGAADALPGAAGWTVDWAKAGKSHSEAYDFVIVATGLYNKPARPAWAERLVRAEPPAAGPWVVDARDFTDASVAEGKHVVVVGGGKTAHDVGVVVSKLAASATLVVRGGAGWMAPQKVLGIIPFEFASYTRWAWALQPPWYAAGALNKAVHALFRPVKALLWGVFAFLFPLHTRTPGNIKPRYGLLPGIYDTVGIIDSGELARAFKSKRLATRAADVVAVTPAGVELSDGSTLPADIVVLATGYHSTARDLLPGSLQAAAGFQGHNQWLYRNVLPPGLSHLAFIGLNATFQHVLTTALQSRWLADVLNGSIKLPPQEQLEADIAKQQAWLKRSPFARKNNYVWAQHGKFHDALVRDIRGRTNAYSRWNPVAEWFGYIKNQRYAPLFPGNLALKGYKDGGAAGAAGTAAGAAGRKHQLGQRRDSAAEVGTVAAE